MATQLFLDGPGTGVSVGMEGNGCGLYVEQDDFWATESGGRAYTFGFDLVDARGAAASDVGSLATVTGPVAGRMIGTAITRPIASAFTMSGTISLNVWGRETDLAANAGFIVSVWRYNAATDSVQIVGTATDDAELGTSNAVRTWTITPTSTNFEIGDRILVMFGIDDVGGTMASGQTVTLTAEGPTGGANGDTFITFTENISFDTTTPSGTKLILRDTASDVDLGASTVTEKEANLGTQGSSAKSIVANTRASPVTGDQVGGAAAYPKILDVAEGVVTSDDSTWELSYPDGVRKGDLLLYVLATNDTLSSATSPSFVDSIGVGENVALGKRVAVDGLSGTFTVTLNAATQGCWKVLRIGGWERTLGINFTGGDANGGSVPAGGYQDGTGTNPNPGAYSPFVWDAGVVPTLYLGICGVRGDATFSANPGSGVVVGANQSSGGASGAGLSVYALEQTSEPGDLGSWTLSASATYRALHIAVQGGGPDVEWYTPQLDAFTLAGKAHVKLRGFESNASANVAFRVEIARVDEDGSNPIFWAGALVARSASSSWEAGTAEASHEAKLMGPPLGVAGGQRLRIRVYICDPLLEALFMASAFTATFRYDGAAAGNGDSYIQLAESVTEWSGPPAPPTPPYLVPMAQVY